MAGLEAPLLKPLYHRPTTERQPSWRGKASDWSDDAVPKRWVLVAAPEGNGRTMRFLQIAVFQRCRGPLTRFHNSRSFPFGVLFGLKEESRQRRAWCTDLVGD